MEHPTVKVGPFDVLDASRRRTVDLLVEAACSDHPILAFDVHVAALTMRHDRAFVQAVHDADLVYADGMSAVMLGRLSGARWIERAPATDIAHDVIDRTAVATGRMVTIGLVGGPPGLAEQAAAELERRHRVEAVVLADGFRSDWSGVLDDICRASPDIVFVGMGVPREMTWSARHRAQFPSALVMTCGGWFGHIVGHERRAPRWAQASGLEWVWRLAQDPRRLLGRYVRGLIAFVSLAGRALTHRHRLSDSREGARGDADD